MVTPTIVAPLNNTVISLAPEFITPQDGDTKQDCEIKASKLLKTNGILYQELEVTVKERMTGKQIYHNAFITNHPLEGKTAQETETILNTIIDCGRAR